MRLDFISGLQLYVLALNQTCCLKSAITQWIWPFPLSIIWCKDAKSLQSCQTLCDPTGCNLPGSSVHGILQARILEWVAMASSRDLPNSGIKPESLMSPALAGRFFTTNTTYLHLKKIPSNLCPIFPIPFLTLHQWGSGTHINFLTLSQILIVWVCKPAL